MALQQAGKIILYSLLAIVGIILIVFLIVLFTSDSDFINQGPGTTEFIIILILSSLFLIGSFYLGFLFIRALLRFLGNLSGFSGDKIPIRLVSLGLVAILFPNVVRAIIAAPVKFFINLVSYFISSLNNSFSNLGGSFSEEDFSQLIRIMLLTLRDTWNLLSNAAMQMFSELQIPNLIIAIAVWVLIGQFLSLILARRTEEGDSRTLVVDFVQNISPNTRKNILLIIVFLISAYLIMASIIAVPWLQQTSSVFQEDWEKEFDDIAGTRETSFASNNEDFSVNPLDTLSDSFFVNQAKLDSLPQWQRLVSRVKLDRYDITQQRALLVEKWKSIRSETWKIKEKLVNSVKRNLSLSIRTLGPLDQAYYYQELHRWLSDNINMLDRYLKRYQSVIQIYDTELEKWVNQILDALQNDLEKVKSWQSTNPQETQRIYFETTSVYNPSSVLSQTLATFAYEIKTPSLGTLPKPPQPGAQWGIFGLISGWLLQANSYALILIIGMLGFGLFGSLISSVVREYSQRQQGEPLIRDLASAVIRGLSAAVVVFLSVKGGLAVFTTDEVEPNAYVLFFTCLAGAVFSEKIWEWAREKLGEKFTTDHQEEGERDDAAEESKQETGQRDETQDQ
jgi:hypothetical protein